MIKKIICYLRTLQHPLFLISMWIDGNTYVAHKYVEQKSYVKGNRLHTPVKCTYCGDVSDAWIQL